MAGGIRMGKPLRREAMWLPLEKAGSLQLLRLRIYLKFTIPFQFWKPARKLPTAA